MSRNKAARKASIELKLGPPGMVKQLDMRRLVDAVVDKICKSQRLAKLAVDLWFVLLERKDDLNSIQYSELATALQEWKLTMDQEMRN